MNVKYMMQCLIIYVLSLTMTSKFSLREDLLTTHLSIRIEWHLSLDSFIDVNRSVLNDTNLLESVSSLTVPSKYFTFLLLSFTGERVVITPCMVLGEALGPLISDTVSPVK